jgi:hypothetical protein
MGGVLPLEAELTEGETNHTALSCPVYSCFCFGMACVLQWLWIGNNDSDQISGPHSANMKTTVVWMLLLMMIVIEAVSASETSFSVYQTTRRNSGRSEFLLSPKLLNDRLVLSFWVFFFHKASYNMQI